ncbi:epoxide hydrolase family protein [Aspergillus undulatus]|uniref:epoxide hydrolase family protein n=1 Tax=Aspergillus undulatus TaxID=1810928 RepID=UPI003CCE2E66
MTAPFTKLPTAASIKPSAFRIAISDEQLADFKTLIKLSKIAPQTYENLQGDRRYGVTHEWMAKMKGEWLDNYDWYHPNSIRRPATYQCRRATEKHANSFPQYTTEIEGLTIHFAALFSEKADAVPIVLLHGWPGSYFEFLPMLQLFKDEFTPSTLPYHLIVPSLPGYAFSSGPPLDRDFTNADSTCIIDQLMRGLGFKSGYVSQGGDIGSRIARLLGVHYESCKAVHLNFCPVPSRPEGVADDNLSDLEKRGLERFDSFLYRGKAYAEEHGTRPATIGHVLSSSPLALLAWIGEKLLEWPDAPLPNKTILDLITLYWFTESFPRAIYPYRESNPLPRNPKEIQSATKELYLHKPFGFSWFPQELMPVPQSWVAKTGNLVYFKQHTEGGHFAALERPKDVKDDLKEFLDKAWPGFAK